jgi:hypothetical protein
MLVARTIGALIGFAAAGLAAIFNLHPASMPVLARLAASVRFLDGRRCFRLEVESSSDLRLLARLLGEPHYAAGELSSGSLQ